MSYGYLFGGTNSTTDRRESRSPRHRRAVTRSTVRAASSSARFDRSAASSKSSLPHTSKLPRTRYVSLRTYRYVPAKKNQPLRPPLRRTRLCRSSTPPSRAHAHQHTQARVLVRAAKISWPITRSLPTCRPWSHVPIRRLAQIISRWCIIDRVLDLTNCLTPASPPRTGFLLFRHSGPPAPNGVCVLAFERRQLPQLLLVRDRDTRHRHRRRVHFERERDRCRETANRAT